LNEQTNEIVPPLPPLWRHDSLKGAEREQRSRGARSRGVEKQRCRVEVLRCEE
jgi:hypothetical protein